MSEALLNCECLRKRTRPYSGLGPYRGTSLIRNSPPPQDFYRALGIVLL